MARFPPGTPHWEDDPLFDLRSHLHRIALPVPCDDQALQEVLSHLISTPLDRARPLWEIHLIENYGNGCVLLFRLHHCLADGMALLHVLRLMTGRSPETHRTAPAPARRPPQGESRRTDGYQPADSEGPHSYSEMVWLLYGGLTNLFHPTHGRNRGERPGTPRPPCASCSSWGKTPRPCSTGRWGSASRSPGQILYRSGRSGRSGVSSGVPSTRCSSPLSQERSARPAGRRARVRRHPPRVRSRESRHGGSAVGLGNRFGLNFLALPIDRDDPVERVTVLRQRLKDLKESAEAEVALLLMNLYGIAPEEIGSPVIDLVRKQSDRRRERRSRAPQCDLLRRQAD